MQVRTLELLKLRFGESALRMCDVMLKDIADSKRVDANIKADSRGSANGLEGTSATIISAVFWPPLGGARSTTNHNESLRIATTRTADASRSRGAGSMRLISF